MVFRWVAVGIPPGDFGRPRMALRWDAVGMPPGYYSDIVADVVLVDHRVGCLATPLRAVCSNSSGSGFVGGFAPLPMRLFLQICCCGHICGEPCLVVYGHQWDGSFVAAVDVAGNIGVVQGELAMELRSHSHYRFHIVAVLVVARHSALAVVNGSRH